jgi:8-oxo-dGTP pyrophosphatase MutT (NUDIX family)
MRWSPHVTVAAVARRDHRYLMVEEAPDGASVINQPAGHLEPGETLVEAVIREVLEETGHAFAPSGLVGIYQWQMPGNTRTYLRFCFTGSVTGPAHRVSLDPDIVAVHWLDRATIADGPLSPRSPLVLRCLDDAEAHDPLPLQALHKIGPTG